MKPELPRPSPSDPGPVARLLGPEAAAGGPLALLGLTPATCNDAAVGDALARQLARLHQHAQGGTPEADEVVMALHTAAAQLLDPTVRPHVMAQWAQRGTGPTMPAPSSLSPREMRRFRQEARGILARFGGLNERSLRRLAQAARRFGVSVEHLPTLLPAILVVEDRRGGPRAGTRVPPAVPPVPVGSVGTRPQELVPERVGSATDGAAPLPEEMDPAVRLLRLGLILGAVAFLALVLGLGGVWLLVKNLGDGPAPEGGSRPATSGPIAGAGGRKELFPSGAGRTDPKAAATPQPLAPDTDADAAVRDLALSVEGLSVNSAEAVARFEHAVALLGRQWGRLTPDKLTAAQDSVVEFVYRCSRWPEVAERAGQAVSAGATALRPPGHALNADQLWSGVWSVGLLSRLARERDLPAAARAVIEGSLASAAGGSASGGSGTFGWGALAAAIAMPRLLVTAPPPTSQAPALAPLETWRTWVQVVTVLCGSDAPARSRMLMAGLETVLLEGPEPTPNSEAERVVVELASQVGWRSGDDSRRRLVRWFDQARVTPTDLRAVTEALAGKSAAEGVDVSMVLAITADEPQRREMRDRYAAAWGLAGGPEHDALVAEWARALTENAPLSEGDAPIHHLARAVVLSRLNEAAGLLFVGESQAPADLVLRAGEPLKAALAGAQVGPLARSLEDGATDGAWAVKYLAAERSIPARTALLVELSKSPGTLGPADAEVLMVEALRGSPYQVRRQAQELVQKFAGSPAVVNAALEMAANVPRTLENAELIRRLSLAGLPSVKDPSWKLAVRRVLVERLVEMLAARGESGVIDALATLLGQSYQGRAFVGPVERGPATPAEKATAEVASRAARLSWLRWAQATTPSGREPLSLEQIARRQAGRDELAAGLIQEFAAQQVGLCELMAYVVVSEQPASSAHAAAVLERLVQSRRAADHVFVQIESCERAMAELWAIRLGVELP